MVLLQCHNVYRGTMRIDIKTTFRNNHWEFAFHPSQRLLSPSRCHSSILIGSKSTNLPSFRHLLIHRTKAISSSPTAMDNPSQQQQQVLESFLSWLIANGVKGIGVKDSKIALYQRNGDERGIVAIQPITKGQTLASVPLHLAITDHPDDEESNAIFASSNNAIAPWSVRLACKILRMKYQGYDCPWFPYISVLPCRVPTPLSTFSWEDISSIGYQPMKTKIDGALWLSSTAWSTLPPSALTAPCHAAAASLDDDDDDDQNKRNDFEWALSVVHSRTFGTAGQRGGIGVRMLVPLIDMLNHAGDTLPNSTQDPPMSSSSGSNSQAVAADNVRWDIVTKIGGDHIMVLTATRDCIAGEEMFLSYGERSNDDFFLYYGFVPQRNYHDNVVLFESIEESLEWYLERNIPKGVLSPEQIQAALVEAYTIGTSDSMTPDSDRCGEGASSSGGLQDKILLYSTGALDDTTQATPPTPFSTTINPAGMEGMSKQELESIQRDQAQIKLSTNMRVDGRLIGAFTVLHSIARTAGSSTVCDNVQQHVREAVSQRAQEVLHSMHSMSGVNILRDLEQLSTWESTLLPEDQVHGFHVLYEKYASKISSSSFLQTIADTIHNADGSRVNKEDVPLAVVVDARVGSDDQMISLFFSGDAEKKESPVTTTGTGTVSPEKTRNNANNVPINALIYRTYKTMILWDAINNE